VEDELFGESTPRFLLFGLFCGFLQNVLRQLIAETEGLAKNMQPSPAAAADA